ncbi:pachytene checkpoint protein 2 homolog isoform X1 [Arachis hypogaea]|uniref:pachytene checkpoint protein 2 homolog isoform X1 n=1 Tax=Arachis hypogaea TaxID=3818 RepID=UPI003B2129F3
MVVGVFLAVTVVVIEAHRRRRERCSLLALLLGVWIEWPRSASASGFYKLLESSAAGNQHWSCPKLVLCSLLKRVLIHSLFYRIGCKTFPKDSRNGKEESNLVFVLIDEVESLAAARKAAISGSNPSDSIQVVNALLTQIDKLKSSPNVIILTTSNITTAIGKSL